MPALTVLICTHNDEATIATALESALQQTAPDSSYKVLVVDDASTDSTPALLAEHAGRSRIEIVRLEQNRGLPGACNIGLKRISTPYFARLDGDDHFQPRLIETLLNAAAGDADIITTDRFELRDGVRRERRLSNPPGVVEMVAAGTLMRTALVLQVGGYRPLFWEEYDLYMRLIDAGAQLEHISMPLYDYRLHDAQMTADPAAQARGWEELEILWSSEALTRHGLGPDRLLD